jgi:hypothetical protein
MIRVLLPIGSALLLRQPSAKYAHIFLDISTGNELTQVWVVDRLLEKYLV